MVDFREKRSYSKFELGGEIEPDFRGKLGTKNLSSAVKESKTKRCIVTDFNSQFAFFFQFNLLNCRSYIRTTATNRTGTAVRHFGQVRMWQARVWEEEEFGFVEGAEVGN